MRRTGGGGQPLSHSLSQSSRAAPGECWPPLPSSQKAKFTLLIRTRLISGFPFLLLVLGCWWLGPAPVIIASTLCGPGGSATTGVLLLWPERCCLGPTGSSGRSPGPAERGFPCDACVFWQTLPHWGCSHISGRGWGPPAMPLPPAPSPTAAAVSLPASSLLPSLLSFLPPSAGLSCILFLVPASSRLWTAAGVIDGVLRDSGWGSRGWPKAGQVLCLLRPSKGGSQTGGPDSRTEGRPRSPYSFCVLEEPVSKTSPVGRGLRIRGLLAASSL